MAPTSRMTMIRRSVPKGGVDADPRAVATIGGPSPAAGGVGVAAVGPGGQRELLEGEARIVGAEQFGDQRLGGVGPEAGVVADDEVDGLRGTPRAPGTHRCAGGGSATSASRIRSTIRTTRTVPATSWTRTIRQPWLTP